MRAFWLTVLLTSGIPAAGDPAPRMTESCTISGPDVDNADTASVGHSLLQSMSFSRRSAAGAILEEILPAVAPESEQEGAKRLMMQIVRRMKEFAQSHWSGIRVLGVFLVLFACFAGYFLCFHPETNKSMQEVDSPRASSCDPRSYDPRVILHNWRMTPLSPALAVRPAPAVGSKQVDGVISSDEDEMS